ncbi:hypothetical protein KSP39_PZI007872 [Platanthera zijinensis]|uniref:Uncharacterized protein n=1 Tax=Platanthera zijinensis TaxID=2320716 RepID=A0AAP0BPW7_9ASPA
MGCSPVAINLHDVSAIFLCRVAPTIRTSRIEICSVVCRLCILYLIHFLHFVLFSFVQLLRIRILKLELKLVDKE